MSKLVVPSKDIVLMPAMTTAQIVYRRPDEQWLLQEFIWQKLDIHPQYPELCKFLRFWEDKIEGPLHSVTVGSVYLIKPRELLMSGGDDFKLLN